MKSTTIFRQLILNVIVPVVLALMLLFTLNHYRTKDILVEANDTKNHLIANEIRSTLEFQDLALEIIEEDIERKLRGYSDKIINDLFKNSSDLKNVDLDSIRNVLGMDSKNEDIYIIDKSGTIINTTFKKDRKLNLFAFGENHKQFLLNIWKSGEFHSERFALEQRTKRIRKYSYQPTADGKYIIELGVYSAQADEAIRFINKSLKRETSEREGILSVDLFILSEENIFSLNSDSKLNSNHDDVLNDVIKTEGEYQFFDDDEGPSIHYHYQFMGRKNTSLYKGSIIRIKSDRSKDGEVLRKTLWQSIGIFSFFIFAVIILIYRKTRIITFPIKKLVENIDRITDGNLNERALVEGNNEITKLSEQFNKMLSRLEEYYSVLEQKVKERTAEILKQKNEIEEQKKSIEDSIVYAKRIQNAILPPDDFIASVLPEYFVLYRPKDIVSGDFFWVSEQEGKVHAAVVDCTGHGVPGAFMSIVGNDQLNYAVNVRGKNSPDQILNALNEGVTNALRQQREGHSVKDGMDMAICSFDFKTNKMEFAGAYNPMYLIRNGELTLVKGDKSPIGGFLGESLHNFSKHDFDLQEGDTIYIFSDGYADQFGGPREKKFKYKRLQELLLSIQDKDLATQKDILNTTIEEWRGEIEQVDDILVMGIRV